MEPASFPESNSQEELVSHDETTGSSLSRRSSSRKSYGSTSSPTVAKGNVESSSRSSSSSSSSAERPITLREGLTVAILCFVNLINYMDRFTIAGILADIQCHFQVGDSEGGLLQTAFIVSYMIFAPIFGYLGDRYSRKILMAVGIFLWSLFTLMGSFVESSFWLFLGLRMCVGIGEASYSTIAPTIIGDLFVGDRRSKMLALFYFAIPVGSGLGYIVGSGTAQAAGSWQWGLRVTPCAGALAVILILLIILDPPRGSSEGAHLTATSWTVDVKSLCRNPSFMLTTFASCAVAFVAGSLAWWGPIFITRGLAYQGDTSASIGDVSLIFGLITVPAGVVGVISGSLLGQKLRVRFPTADPVISGAGLLISAPLMYATILMAVGPTPPTYATMFFAQWFLNLNWAICGDILLYVVLPTRRSTAEAFQILLSHLLGDAGSPYLIGVVCDALKGLLGPSQSLESHVPSGARLSSWSGTTAVPTTAAPSVNCSISSIDTDNIDVDFKALQYSLFITVFVEILGGFFFLASAWYIVQDKEKVDRAARETETLTITAGENDFIGSVEDLKTTSSEVHQSNEETCE